jgi:hypothetical protein
MWKVCFPQVCYIQKHATNSKTHPYQYDLGCTFPEVSPNGKEILVRGIRANIYNCPLKCDENINHRHVFAGKNSYEHLYL